MAHVMDFFKEIKVGANMRNRKSQTVTMNLRQGREFRSNQGVVWDEIEKKYDRMSARPSPTMARSLGLQS